MTSRYMCAGVEMQASGATAARITGVKYVPPDQRGGKRSRGSGEMLGWSHMNRDGEDGVCLEDGCGQYNVV